MRFWLPIPVLLFCSVISGQEGDVSMKEGIWSSSTTIIHSPGNKTFKSSASVCHSHDFDKAAKLAAEKEKVCKTLSERSSGGTLIFELECKVGKFSIRTEGTSSRSADSAMRYEAHSIYDPPMGELKEMTVITDSKYMGACPAGIEPGDIIASDGKITHTKWQH